MKTTTRWQKTTTYTGNKKTFKRGLIWWMLARQRQTFSIQSKGIAPVGSGRSLSTRAGMLLATIETIFDWVWNRFTRRYITTTKSSRSIVFTASMCTRLLLIIFVMTRKQSHRLWRDQRGDQRQRESDQEVSLSTSLSLLFVALFVGKRAITKEHARTQARRKSLKTLKKNR